MIKCNSVETLNKYLDSSDKVKFRLMKLKTISAQKFEKKVTSKKLSKYIAVFDYIDKILIVLSATSGVIFIISFTIIVGVPVGIASASFSL